jgi:hypothetical protein
VERVELHEVTVKVYDPKMVISVSQSINTLLKRGHKKKDYEIIVPLELLKRAERTNKSSISCSAQLRQFHSCRRYRNYEHNACHSNRKNP